MQRIILEKKSYRSSGEKDDFDKEFWRKAGHEARFAATWEMVNEVHLIRGENNVCQPGLQRSVQTIKRRSR